MSDDSMIRIGTRSSELATWQARRVAKQLNELGYESELVFVTSQGDKDRTTPLTELGGKGVFTKALDEAQLNDEIDIAVHSFKDLPTENPLPLKVAAVPQRGDPRDSLVAPGGPDFLKEDDYEAIIATGSNRRRAQWLNRYPNHTVVNLRGNVNTRLEKVRSKDWDGAIFAAAGLQRIDLDHHITQYLHWMLPASAQGAMAVMIREKDEDMEEIIRQLNHDETALCTSVEREFLHEMEAGCSAPVGAYASIEEGQLHFEAAALELDGSKRYHFEEAVSVGEAGGLGRKAAQQLLNEGALEIITNLDS